MPPTHDHVTDKMEMELPVRVIEVRGTWERRVNAESHDTAVTAPASTA